LKLVNLDNGAVIGWEIRKAYTFLRRLMGLAFTKELPVGYALHIQPCRSVHTFFMNYALDVIYLDEQMKVVGCEEYLQPGKIGKQFPGVRSVVELPAGRIRETETSVGQALQFK
jgi:uncharacterized membrane protein (UPF0127 family)